jgi:hypothetical protein
MIVLQLLPSQGTLTPEQEPLKSVSYNSSFTFSLPFNLSAPLYKVPVIYLFNTYDDSYFIELRASHRLFDFQVALTAIPRSHSFLHDNAI